MSEMFDFKNYQWRKMANNGEKWRKMAMANLPFPFVKFAISPLAPPDKQFVLKIRETKLVVDYTFSVVLLCCLSVFLMPSRVI